MARLNVYLAAVAASLAVVHGGSHLADSGAPSITAEGGNLVLNAADVLISTTSITEMIATITASKAATDTNADSIAKVLARITGVDDKVQGVENEVSGVADDLDKVAANVQTNIQDVTDIKNTMATQQDYTKLKAENEKLRTAIGSLETQLKEVVSKVGYVPEMCDKLEDPAGGVVSIIGDHGEKKVPVSVTAYFKCNAKYFLAGDGKTKSTTCQHDLASNKAKWSGGGKHPGCKGCMQNCDECTAADACVKCKIGTTFVTGKGCTAVNGLTQATAAESCLAILKQNPQARSQGAGYWIKLPGTGQARRMWCMMKDWDPSGGGGWTMVGRGVGGNQGCWSTADKTTECNVRGMTNTRVSFQYSDDVVAAIPHTAIWYQGFGTVKAKFYFEADRSKGQCAYTHSGAMKGKCACPHAKADLSDKCTTDTTPNDKGEFRGVGADPCLHTSITSEPGVRAHSWYMRKQGATECGKQNIDHCHGDLQGCNVGIYVR